MLLPSRSLKISPLVHPLTVNRYFKRLKLDYPTPDTTRGSRRFVKAMKHLTVGQDQLPVCL